MGSLLEEMYYALGVFLAVEEYFNITIADKEASEINTIEELIDLVKKKVAENDSRH